MLLGWIGDQDLAAQVARRPGVDEKRGDSGLRSQRIAPPFGTIDDATLRFAQPDATGLPAGSVLTHFDPGGEITASIAPDAMAVDIEAAAPPAVAQVNRGPKGARLVPRIGSDFNAPQPAGDPDAPQADTPSEPLPRQPDARAPETPGAEAAPDDTDIAGRDPADDDSAPPLIDDESAPIRAARIYFGTDPLGGMLLRIEPRAPGQTPLFEPPDPQSRVRRRAPPPCPPIGRATKRLRPKAESTAASMAAWMAKPPAKAAA